LFYSEYIELHVDATIDFIFSSTKLQTIPLGINETLKFSSK